MMRITRKASGRRGFYSNSARWRRESAAFKREHSVCEHQGCTDPSAFTDHIRPIADPYNLADPLMWDRANWQALCDYHHRLKSRRELGETGRLAKVKRARGRQRVDPVTGWGEWEV
jgi:5-methylcytosine-specific restriction endonuclease McrA